MQCPKTRRGRSNTRDEFVICQAQVEKGIIEDLGSVSGNPTPPTKTPRRAQKVHQLPVRALDQLEPEDSTQHQPRQIVLEPKFMPRSDADRGITGASSSACLVRHFVGDGNAKSRIDLLRRSIGGPPQPLPRPATPNPRGALARSEPAQENSICLPGRALPRRANILFVDDPYLNLDSRQKNVSKGWDFGLFYNVPDFGIGKFRPALQRGAAGKLRAIGRTRRAGTDPTGSLPGCCHPK